MPLESMPVTARRGDLQYWVAMRLNRTKQRLKDGHAAVGVSHSQLGTAEIPKMFAAANLDWVFLDSDHSPISSDTLHDLIRAYLMTDVTVVVRVCDFQYDLVARALDSGAEGVIFPRCEDPGQLEQAIRGAKFPPQGRRGYGLGPPQVGYRGMTFAEIMSHANEQTLSIAQVESTTALERLDELASVPGLDALLAGPADLSVSLGVPGDWKHPKLVAAIDRMIAVCNDKGVFPAIQVRSFDLADFWIDRGMKLIGCGNELAILWGAVSGLAKQLREKADGCRGGD